MRYTDDRPEDWGSWSQAEQWRRQSFAARTPAQRLRWLKSALALAYRSGALRPGPAPYQTRAHHAETARGREGTAEQGKNDTMGRPEDEKDRRGP